MTDCNRQAENAIHHVVTGALERRQQHHGDWPRHNRLHRGYSGLRALRILRALRKRRIKKYRRAISAKI